MHVYIAPELGNPVLRRCTIIISLTQICFNPSPTLTPDGAYNVLSGSRFIDNRTNRHMTTLQLPEPRN